MDPIKNQFSPGAGSPPPGPINEYGRQKAATERGVLALDSRNLVIRTSGAFGLNTGLLKPTSMPQLGSPTPRPKESSLRTDKVRAAVSRCKHPARIIAINPLQQLQMPRCRATI